MLRRIAFVPATALVLVLASSAAGAGPGGATTDAVEGPQLSPEPTPRAATAVTVGQTAPPGASSYKCTGTAEQPDHMLVTQHQTWKMPSDGVVTSFSHQGGQVVTAGNYVRAVVLRHETSPWGYRIIGKTVSMLPVPGTLATRPSRISVRTGDILAVHSKGVPGADACHFSSPGVTSSSKHEDIDTTDFIDDGSGGQSGHGAPNVSVVLEPDADRDGFGDVSQDRCAVDAAFQGPCPVPDTKVTKSPKKKGYARKVKVKFTSSIAGATFTCTVDFKDPRPCRSPFKIKVGVGKHRLLVQATSARYGTTELKPADIRWKVLTKDD